MSTYGQQQPSLPHSTLSAFSRPVGYTSFVAHYRPILISKPEYIHSSAIEIARILVKQWLQSSEEERKSFEFIDQANAAVLAATDFTNEVCEGELPPRFTTSSPPPPLPPRVDNVSNMSTSLSPSIHLTSAFNFYEPLKLENLRNALIRLEESIIFALIERSQFKLNPAIYSTSAMPQFKGQSFLNFFLFETEKLHAKVRRYTSPDEHPFAPVESLPPPILPQLNYPVTLKPNKINLNDKIMSYYIDQMLPSICKAEDDQNYGSAATADITCLQLLSKRIHYGKFVAESKFRSEIEAFTAAILSNDIDKLNELITKPIVEEQVLVRVHLKAATYGSEPIATPVSSPALAPTKIIHSSSFNTLSSLSSVQDSNNNTHNTNNQTEGSLILIDKESPPSVTGPPSSNISTTSNNTNSIGLSSSKVVNVSGVAGYEFSKGKYKISPDIIAQIYQYIMTLNKEVQIQYLLQRLD